MIPQRIAPYQFIAIAGARQVYDPQPAPGGADKILLEDGSSYLLLENGDKILLES